MPPQTDAHIPRSQAVHELALLTTYYGVRADNIASVVADKEYSECLTLPGFSDGKDYTDFAKVTHMRARTRTCTRTCTLAQTC